MQKDQVRQFFKICAINDDVVVFPCVPATAIVREVSVIIPNTSARFLILNPLNEKTHILYDPLDSRSILLKYFL